MHINVRGLRPLKPRGKGDFLGAMPPNPAERLKLMRMDLTPYHPSR
jgi:hypothetical protein